MRLNNILEFETKSEPEYRVSSFSYPRDNDENKELNLSHVYLPAHVQADRNTVLRLMKDNDVIIEDKWRKIKRYIKDNINDLNGTFNVVTLKGMVLHSFELSSDQKDDE